MFITCWWKENNNKIRFSVG